MPRAGGAAHGAKHRSKGNHGGNGGSKGAKGKQAKDEAFMQKVTSMQEDGAWQTVNSMEDLKDNLANDQELRQMVDKYSHEVFHDAEMLPAVVLMNDGRFDDLCFADVQDLFRCLDTDASGFLEFEEIEVFLKEVLDPPCTDAQIEAIYDQTDKNGDREVSPEEFYRAIMGPVKATLKKAQRENIVKKQFEEKFGPNVLVDRDLLVDKLRWSVGRDDAFRTLPFSLVYICIFIFLVIAHLDIWSRQQLERGNVAWIDGAGAKLLGPYLGSVGSIDGMFDWLLTSGLSAVLGDCRRDLARESLCRVGPRSVIIGDAELKQTRKDGSVQSIWLLHSEQAQAHLRLKPEDYLGAATAAVGLAYESNWADAGTMDLRLTFTTYGLRTELFAITDIKVRFDEYGYAMPSTSSSAVVVKPYPSTIVGKIVYAAFDVFYVFFLLRPMYHELVDMCRAVHATGFRDGMRGYWDFWNCVDWVSIVTGIGSTCVWFLCCQAMKADSIQGLLKDDGERLVLAPGAMQISASKLDELNMDFRRIISLFRMLHIIMGLTSCSILMKFFKAFQANPRLQVVTNTMVKAASDIVHFSIVFLVVFLGFAVTGHILFGNDVKHFRSISSSINTCFIALMGDFAWYSDASASDNGLASGMPYSIMAAWFWLYMVFVLMIMLNMLLAIILDHYSEIVAQIKMDTDVPALWEQAYRYVHASKATTGHIPLVSLVHLLEDDGTPCHTGSQVNEHTLLEAFPEMQQEQAKHLMLFLKNEARKASLDGDGEIIERTRVLGEVIENLSQDVHIVKLNSAVCTSMLRSQVSVEQAQSAASEMRQLFSAGLGDQATEQVDRLCLKMAGAIRELTHKMDAAIQEMTHQEDAIDEMVTGAPQEHAMPSMRIGSLRSCMPAQTCYGADVTVIEQGPADVVGSRR